MRAMHKMLFFFFILLFSFKTQQKLASDPSVDHPYELSMVSTSLSLSANQNKNTDDACLQKRNVEPTRNLLNDFSPPERLILDYISNTQFELLDQIKENRLYSDGFISVENKPHHSSESSKEIIHQQRLLQTEMNFINVLEDNIEIGNIWENNMEIEISFGESENDEGEIESNFEGEGAENEFESGSESGGEGEMEESDEEGETGEEGSWLEGEVCFENLSSDEEIIILEGQQSESEVETSRLLASDIDINIHVDINIDIEKVQEQNNEEAEIANLTITSINPGEQNCHSQRICRIVTIPRLGKKCLCRQVVVCTY